MTAARDPPPDADQFPQLSRGEPRRSAASLVVLTGPNGAGKTNLIEAISFLAPGRGLAPRHARRGGVLARATAPGRSSAEIEGMLGLATLGTGIEPPAGEDATRTRAMPHRPRAGRLGGGLRRSSARGLADAGDGPAVHRPGVGAAALPRPAGARGRRRALRAASTRSSARCARATGCWRTRAPTRIGSTPSSTRPPSLRSRSRRSAPRPCAACRARSRAPQGRRLPVRRDRARRLDGAAAAGASRGRDRGPLSRRAQGQPRARRRRRPHARRPAPHRSRGHLRAEGHCRAADASTGEQKALLIGLVLAHAGLIAEMTGFAPVLLLDEVVAHLDPDAPRGALRRARRARRAGVHDRRRSGRLRRRRARRPRCSRVSPGRVAAQPSEFTRLESSAGESSRNIRSCQGLNTASGRGRTMKRQRAGEHHVSDRTGKGAIAARPLSSLRARYRPRRILGRRAGWPGAAGARISRRPIDLSRHLLPSIRRDQ